MSPFRNLTFSRKFLAPFGFELGVAFTRPAACAPRRPPKPAVSRALVFLGCEVARDGEEWAVSWPGRPARIVLAALIVGDLIWLAGEWLVTGHF